DLPRRRRADFRTPLPEDVHWFYSLRYQLLDSQDQVLLDRVYHLRTRLTEFDDDETRQAVTGAYYLGHDVIPAAGRTVLVSLAELRGPAARLRVRLEGAQDPLTGAVVRVYFNEETPPFKLRYLWNRLYEDRQLRMARGNVYSVDLLSDDEKRNLLLN